MIEVRTLTRDFGQGRGVFDLNFSVPTGAVTGLVGPNGAGKTTALRLILGLERPDGGSALCAGLPYTAHDNPAEIVGVALDADGFRARMTVRQHLTAQTILTGAPRERVDEVLAEVGLADATGYSTQTLSLGMRQRLAIGHALLSRPSAYLFDEPTNGLDPEGIVWFRGLVRQLADGGAAVLVSSHLINELEMVADRVVVMHRGRVLAERDALAFAESAGRSYVVPANQRSALAEAGLAFVETVAGLHVAPDDLTQVRECLPNVDLIEARPDLEHALRSTLRAAEDSLAHV